MKITFEPIGIVHSPFTDLANMPIQPTGEKAAAGTLEIYAPYCEALADLDGFSHMYALYFFHQVNGWKPKVVPFLDKQPRGLFSTRAPRRPNPVGLSLLRIISIDGCRINVRRIGYSERHTPCWISNPISPPSKNRKMCASAGWRDIRSR